MPGTGARCSCTANFSILLCLNELDAAAPALPLRVVSSLEGRACSFLRFLFALVEPNGRPFFTGALGASAVARCGCHVRFP